MNTEISLMSLMESWVKDKFPEIRIDAVDGIGTRRLYLDPVVEGNEYTGLIGSIREQVVMLWDNGETKLAGPRYFYYDPRDPKFFAQVYEHLVRIIELGKVT